MNLKQDVLGRNLSIKDREYFSWDKDFDNKVSKRVKDSMNIFGDIRIPVSLGLVEGVTLDSFIGINPDIDSAGSEDLIYQGGKYTYLTAPDFLFVLSTNANDKDLAPNNTGARKVIIQGLNENYEEVTEILSLNGTAQIPTTNQYIRVNNFFVFDVGSEGRNLGEISLKDQTTTAITVSYIGLNSQNEGTNRAYQFIYTVPVGKVAILNQLTGSIARGSGSSAIKEAGTTLQIRAFGSSVFTPIGGVSSRSDGSSVNLSDLNYPAALPEKMDIKAECLSFSNNTLLTLTTSLLLLDKETFGLI